MKIVYRVAGVAVLAAAAVSGYLLIRAERSLSAAEAYIEQAAWKSARSELDRYLWLHPRDGKARLLMAEALIRDDRLPSQDKIPRALEQLEQIDGESAQAGEARMREGRIRLLLLHQPGRAEHALRESLQHDAAAFHANYLLWKLLDMTGRSHLAEPNFWRVYAKTAADERASRLREWYMSQFHPAAATPELDRMLGVLGPDEIPGGTTAYRRLQDFLRSEPDSMMLRAAIAKWLLENLRHREAAQVLKQASQQNGAAGDAFFVAMMVSVHVELGDFPTAVEWFRRWPAPRRGYDFRLWQGIILEEVDGDYAAAARAYQQALAHWPGPIDWSTKTRLANCLMRAGQQPPALKIRAVIKSMEKLMSFDNHRRLRRVLADLDSPAAIEQARDFYRSLGCLREANAWDAVIERIKQRTKRRTAR